MTRAKQTREHSGAPSSGLAGGRMEAEGRGQAGRTEAARAGTAGSDSGRAEGKRLARKPTDGTKAGTGLSAWTRGWRPLQGRTPVHGRTPIRDRTPLHSGTPIRDRRPILGKGALWGALLLIVLAASAGLSLTLSASRDEHRAVATVNGEPIAEGEVEALMERLKPEVRNYFSRQGLKVDSAAFWEQEHRGEQPIQVLRARAMEEAVRRKLEMVLAKQYGLIGFTTYAELQQAHQQENERRKEAVARGEVIYGPVTYSEIEYANYLISNVRIRLKSEMSKSPDDPLYVSDGEAEASYLSHQAQWDATSESITIRIISVPYHTAEERASSYETALSASEELEQGISFEEVSRKYNREGEILTRRFTPDTYKEDIRASYNLLTAAQGLDRGQYSPEPVENGGSWNIVQLTDRSSEGGDDHQRRLDSVRRSVIDEKYEAYVEELMHTATVEIRDERYENAWKGE